MLRACGGLPMLNMDGVRIVVSYQRLTWMVVVCVCGEVSALKIDGVKGLR